MKKWMIIGAFFVGFLSLASVGHTSPGTSSGKKVFVYSATSSLLKKGFFAGLKRDHQHRDNTIVLSLRSRNLLSITAFPAIREICPVPGIFCSAGSVTEVRETARLSWDHLLHLFPSHYFW